MADEHGVMDEVKVAPRPLDRLIDILPCPQASRLQSNAARARASFGDRVIWHVSSTGRGGGVAEMLQSLLAYGTGAGIANHWLVLDGDEGFFRITKRLHNMLHGSAGDVGPLGQTDHDHYRHVLAGNLAHLLERVSPGDIVLLHDPQAAGLAEGLRRHGARVVWRCHVGSDRSNDLTTAGWEFLREYVQHAERLVFSRPVYAPTWAGGARLAVIPPSIDPFSTKNAPLTAEQVVTVLATVGLVDGPAAGGEVGFVRRDGTPGEVRSRQAGSVLLDTPPPSYRVPLVVQVSRWDRLKDMTGVMAGFAAAVAAGAVGEAELMLVGPQVAGVSDDPEDAKVLAECRRQWRRQPDKTRDRIHLAALPMDDVDENATIVNAVQRHATVVVQKSLAEGFGLTVTEPMWKGRPVVASRVGGIQDQIIHEESGLLLDDPTDLDTFAALLQRVLADQGAADRLGQAAHERVLSGFLADRHLNQYVDLFVDLIGGPRG